MMQTRRSVHLDEVFVRSAPEAVKMYEEVGCELSRNLSFGWDPLANNEDAYELRDTLFTAQLFSGQSLFSDVVHENSESLQEGIEYFYYLTLTN